jgi:hypothetical protein
MNWRNEILSIGTMLIVAILGWWAAYLDHKKTSSSSWEAVYLPRIVGVLFGGLWWRNPFNIRGLVLQLLVYIVTLALILSTFGFISSITRGRCVGITSIVLSIMGLAYYYRRKNDRS